MAWADPEVLGGIVFDGHTRFAHVFRLGHHDANERGLVLFFGHEALRFRSCRREKFDDFRAPGLRHERDFVRGRREMRAAVEGVDAVRVAKADALEQLLDAARL